MLRTLPAKGFVFSLALHAGAFGGIWWWSSGGNRAVSVPFAAGESAAIELRLIAVPRRPRLLPVPATRPLVSEPGVQPSVPPAAPTPRVEAMDRADVEVQLDPSVELEPTNLDVAPPSIGRRGVRTAARALGEIQPEYPQRCRLLGHQGTCSIEILLDQSGRVTETRLLESAGCQELNQAALEAIRKARFLPANSGDETVISRLTQRVRFKLTNR